MSLETYIIYQANSPPGTTHCIISVLNKSIKGKNEEGYKKAVVTVLCQGQLLHSDTALLLLLKEKWFSWPRRQNFPDKNRALNCRRRLYVPYKERVGRCYYKD